MMDDPSTRFPPGHWYSPLPDLKEIRGRAEAIFARPPVLQGIDLNADGQCRLLRAFGAGPAIGWQDDATPGRRYRYNNDWFGAHDALALAGMLAYFRPRRIIEVGSGWSSAALLDAADVLEMDVALTCVDPDPSRLDRLLTDADRRRVTVEPCPVQAVAIETFDALAADDVLFIDSSHVAKVGSDVNWLFFEVLPRLAAGVLVHVHDVFYPFEYPADWVYEGRAWTEAYLLRAFLMHNTAWRIAYWCDYLTHFHRDALALYLPAALTRTGGSLWVRRI